MKRFFVGVKGIILDSEKGVLLLGREYQSGNFWDTPGGRIDGDEDFESTLRRELNEELPGATNIQVSDLLGTVRIHKDIEPDTGLVLLYFRVSLKLPDPLALSEEHNSFIWIKDAESIPSEINPELSRILKTVL